MRKTIVCILGLMSLVMTYSLDRIGYKNKYPIVSIGMTSYLYLFYLIIVGLITVAILNKRAYITFFYKSNILQRTHIRLKIKKFWLLLAYFFIFLNGAKFQKDWTTFILDILQWSTI